MYSKSWKKGIHSDFSGFIPKSFISWNEKINQISQCISQSNDSKNNEINNLLKIFNQKLLEFSQKSLDLKEFPVFESWQF